MAKVSFILIAFAAILSTTVASSFGPRPDKSQEQTNEKASPSQNSNIKVELTSVSSFLGPATSRYKVGDQIPITITMTNTTKLPIYTCVSSSLYQNLPKLTKNGEVVPYLPWQSNIRQYSQRNNTCAEENLPEPVLLDPNKPTLADWFVLVDSRISSGADAWYDVLSPGKYELSIQRRLACCDGPMIQSDKISFEVVP